METENIKSGNGQTDVQDDNRVIVKIRYLKDKEIYKKIENGIKECERMVSEIDTTLENLENDLKEWINKGFHIPDEYIIYEQIENGDKK